MVHFSNTIISVHHMICTVGSQGSIVRMLRGCLEEVVLIVCMHS